MTTAEPNAAAPVEEPSRRRRSRGIALACLVAVAAGLWWTAGDAVQPAHLARHEERLRELLSERPIAFTAAVFVGYVAFVGLSLPGAAVLTPLIGWMFGLWRGVILAGFAATAGATLAMLLSRYVFRDAVQRRYGARLATVSAALEREGSWYLLAMRLVPAVPFFLINVLMGLTSMRVTTFWWVSQLGMLPGTCLFVYAGTQVPALAELSRSPGAVLSGPLIAALTAIGLLPLVLRYLLQRLHRPPSTEPERPDDADRRTPSAHPV